MSQTSVLEMRALIASLQHSLFVTSKLAVHALLRKDTTGRDLLIDQSRHCFHCEKHAVMEDSRTEKSWEEGHSSSLSHRTAFGLPGSKRPRSSRLQAGLVIASSGQQLVLFGYSCTHQEARRCRTVAQLTP